MKSVDTKNIFYGVFASNTLELPSNYPAACIVNTDNSPKTGQHWIAMMFNQPGEVEYFDSYGLTPYVFPPFFDFIRSKFKADSWTFSEHIIQDPSSSTCGLHCKYFIYQRINGVSFNEIITKLYKKDKCWNDSMVVSFCNKIKHNYNLNITIPNNIVSQKCDCKKYFIY